MPALADLLRLDDAGFRKMFAGSPVRRTGHVRFLRNVLIAAGNSGDCGLAPLIVTHLGHADPLVRGMAVGPCRLANKQAKGYGYAVSNMKQTMQWC